MGRRPIEKSMADLDATLLRKIDEALRSEAGESVASIYRRFGLAQRGINDRTFRYYATSIRSIEWTDPIMPAPPNVEQMREALHIRLLESAQSGEMKPYEVASALARIQQYDRMEIQRAAEARAADEYRRKLEAIEKAKVEADSKLDRMAVEKGIPGDVAERIKDLYGITV